MRLVIFEDDGFSLLYPLTYLRPTFALKCGFNSLGEKIERNYPGASVAYFVRDWIARAFAETTKNPVNSAAALKGDDILLVNGRVLAMGEMPAKSGDNRCALVGESLAWARVNKATADRWAAADIAAFIAKARAELSTEQAKVELITYPWHLIEHNPKVITEEFKLAGRSGVEGTMSDHAAIWGPKDQVYVGKGATLQPFVALDCTGGPIYIDEKVKIEANTRVEGPCYIGKGSRIVGGKIREGCSIGPVCRVGGEVEESIIHGYSNKYHDGFLGHAYVCEWVNLGGLTTNSDLKNDYSNVEVCINGQPMNTGSTKVGAFFGDHTKTSIGTLFNTGTMVGIMCNLVGGSGLLPKFAPSFAMFYEGKFFKLSPKNLLETARIAMGRRDCKLSDAMSELIQHVHELTKPERTEAIKKARG